MAFVTIAALVALAIRRVAVPYSVALVGVGLAVGLVVPTLKLDITPELVLVVLLPGLVFEASFHIDLVALRRSFGSVALLAGPGVVVVAAVVAISLHLGTGLPLELGFIVGAMVAATDPAAVVATFKGLGVPHRLAAMTEGESLFNDGTGLVLFALAVRAITSTVSPAQALEIIVVTVVVSAVIGGIAGYLASRILATVEDHLIELTISVSAAYGTYLLADAFHESGVIATVIAGIVIGNYGRRTGISPRADGHQPAGGRGPRHGLGVRSLPAHCPGVHAGRALDLPATAGGGAALGRVEIAGTLVGRALVVYGLLGGAWRIRSSRSTARRARTRMAERALLVRSARRGRGGHGALAPAGCAGARPAPGITFGIVLFTLLVQGMTIEPLVRRWLRPEKEPA